MSEADQALQKLREWTDPDRPLPIGYTGVCIACGAPENYVYHVPENIWRNVIPKRWWHKIVCAKCFHWLANGVVNSRSVP